jgi:hypothetical protein
MYMQVIILGQYPFKKLYNTLAESMNSVQIVNDDNKCN